MKRMGFLGWGTLFASSLLAFSACQLESDEAPPVSTQHEAAQQTLAKSSAPALPDRFEVTLPWGTGPGQLRLEQATTESLAYGPNAVAVADNGESIILDRLAERIVRVGADGEVRVVATVAKDAEDLVAGDGSVVAFSPVRARAWFFDMGGKPAGEMHVHRELRQLVRLSVGASRRLTAHTGYQEQLQLGSPSAPLALEATLRTKQEGAHLLADGTGIAVRAGQGRAELLQLSQTEGETRSRALRNVALSGQITAARVIGGDGHVVCLRTEQVRSVPELVVKRRAVCVNAATDAVLFDEALPAPGVYLPRTELAFQNGRLTHIHAAEAGLVVTNLVVAGGEVSK